MANDAYIVTARQGRAGNQARRYGFRAAESFFRRWPLYVVPVLLLSALGVLEAKKVVADFKSVGVMNVVNNPLLGDLGNLQAAGTPGFETPATTTARTINELLGTDGFVEEVAQRAGLKQALATGEVSVLDIRSRVYASASGYQLLQIISTWPSGPTSQQLAQATIDNYVAYVVNSEVSKTKDASAFWAQRQQAYQTKLTAAEQDLKKYLAAHPAPDFGDRPDSQTLDIKTLNDAITSAQQQVTNAQGQQESADLSTQQLTEATQQALQVVDKPRVPDIAQSIRRKQALTIVIFLVLGLIVAGGLLVISTFLDRTVRSGEDVSAATGLSVVATVPAISILRKQKPQGDRPKEKRKAA